MNTAPNFELVSQAVSVIFSVILFVAFCMGATGLWRKLRRQDVENEKPQPSHTRESMVRLFVDIVEKSDLADSYVANYGTAHLGLYDYVAIRRKETRTSVVRIEIGSASDPKHNVQVTAYEPEELYWHFGSNQKGLKEAVDHVTIRLRNLVVQV